MDVQKLLSELFGLQEFEEEPALQKIIDETKERYLTDELSDDALSEISAAGDPYTQTTAPKKRKGKP